jgi:hypothetical protein
MAAKKTSGGKVAKPEKTMGKRPRKPKKTNALKKAAGRRTGPGEAPKKRGRPPKPKGDGPTAQAMRDSIAGPKKRGRPPKALTAEQRAVVPDALHAAAELGDADAIEHRARILKAYDALKRAEARKAEVTKECRDRTNQEKATFQTTIEAPVQDKAPKESLLSWIRRTQAAWQDVNETDLLNKEEKKLAGKAFRQTRKIFDDTITNVSQLALPFPEVTEELPAPVAEAVRGGNVEQAQSTSGDDDPSLLEDDLDEDEDEDEDEDDLDEDEGDLDEDEDEDEEQDTDTESDPNELDFDR